MKQKTKGRDSNSRCNFLANVHSSQDPISDLHQTEQNHSGRHWNTEKNETHHSQSQAWPSVHHLRLQHTQCLAHERVIAGVVLLLPLIPIWRRLIVPLHHLHLMDSLPQNNHILIHQSAAAAIVVLVIGFWWWSSGWCTNSCGGGSFSEIYRFSWWIWNWVKWKWIWWRKERNWCHLMVEVRNRESKRNIN